MMVKKREKGKEKRKGGHTIRKKIKK